MEVRTNSLSDTEKLAEIFARCLPQCGAFVSLFGDIGAGKTAFVRLVLKKIGVKDKVTSPSFVILNEYKGGKFPVYHFDLYRLEKEGLETIKEELREYSKQNILTFVEWADFGAGELPYNRLNIKVRYDDTDYNDTRFYSFEPVGHEYEQLIENMKTPLKEAGFKL